jgi:hypothetical protein
MRIPAAIIALTNAATDAHPPAAQNKPPMAPATLDPT